MGSTPGWTYGYVPTPAQWSAAFAAKQDDLGYSPLNRGGDSMAGPLITFGSTTGASGFKLSPGTAPATPKDGDMWVTSSGLFVRVNGTTVGPLGPGSVTSVGFSAPAELTVTNSPVTGTGTLTVAWADQTAKKFLASPVGATGTPSFRTFTSSDLPAGAAQDNLGYQPAALSGNNVFGGTNTFSTTKFFVVDATDATKRIGWVASGITAGQTRTVTMPDYNVTLRPTAVGFRAHRNGSAQSPVTAGTWTKVAATAEAYDQGGYYDAPNAKWTPPAGLVRMTACVQFSGTNIVDTQATIAGIYKNGSELAECLIRATASSAANASMVTVEDQANGTDYYEMWAFCGNPGSGDKTIAGGTTVTYWCGSN